MPKIMEIEGRIDALRADRAAREARLEEIEPEADELRSKLRRARGEAELGDTTARKTVAALEGKLAALAGEEDAATGAIEVLGERIAAAEAELATAKADEKASIEAACRAAEEEAFAEYSAIMATVVGPLERMAAACRVAEAHGVEIPGHNRAHATRRRLASAGVSTVREERRGHRLRKVYEAGAAGIPDALREKEFQLGLAVALENLVAELQHAGVPIRDVKLPEPELPEKPTRSVPDPAFRMRHNSEFSEVILMGRGRPEELDAFGRPVEQSARPRSARKS